MVLVIHQSLTSLSNGREGAVAMFAPNLYDIQCRVDVQEVVQSPHWTCRMRILLNSRLRIDRPRSGGIDRMLTVKFFEPLDDFTQCHYLPPDFKSADSAGMEEPSQSFSCVLDTRDQLHDAWLAGVVPGPGLWRLLRNRLWSVQHRPDSRYQASRITVHRIQERSIGLLEMIRSTNPKVRRTCKFHLECNRIVPTVAHLGRWRGPFAGSHGSSAPTWGGGSTKRPPPPVLSCGSGTSVFPGCGAFGVHAVVSLGQLVNSSGPADDANFTYDADGMLTSRASLVVRDCGLEGGVVEVAYRQRGQLGLGDGGVLHLGRRRRPAR